MPNAVWLFDVERHDFWWGNEAAVAFWDLTSLEQLTAKDLSSDSEGIRRRIAQSFEAAAEQGMTVDPWTTYPNGQPKTVLIKHRAVLVGPDRHRAVMGIIFEDIDIGEEPEHLLFVEAMRYTDVCVTSYFLDGAPVCQNPAAAEAYGGSVRSNRASDTPVFVSRFENTDEGREILEGIVGNGACGRFECRMNRLDGVRWHSLDIRMSRHPLTGDQVFVVCEDDVTELRDAVRAANSANDAKSAFLAVMSHELRTPLNGILGLTEALNADDLQEEQREMLGSVQESAKGLLTILNDILDLSKIEAGEMRLDPHPMNLAKLIGSTTAFWRPAITAKGIDFDVDRGNLEGLPDVVGDALRIRQILSNFLSNAAKFTETGSIAIRSSAEVQTAGEIAVRFEIRDSGIGMSEEVQDRLFSAFVQADDSTSRKYGGTGLGLNICRQLAELMGGSVGVESRPGEGSRFFLTLELKAAAVQQAESLEDDDQALEELLKQRKSIRVLVADDNAINQKIIQAFLSSLPCDLTFVSNGAEALQAVKSLDFDLVLMDSQMPEMDGMTATREIRALPMPKRSVPIIAVTANALEEDKQRYLAAGLDEHITKPIERKLLYAAIQRQTAKG
ncbi:ATP-binding protein [Pelagibius sp. Alg239-R121]|uniref:ATP-binding protein n=1 Tax=Pelagibius sp. Alg239-R121 TaxID=2993448 RepID=UPI0024A6A6B2|nr:ATP-binding protein [Pelagibius sp. Alg239-R121]